MKNFLILLILTTGLAGALQAQNEAIFTHYMINQTLINPAAAGFEEEHQIMGHVRTHHAGFDGSPNTYRLYYNGPIGKTFGLGANVFTDRAASLNKFHMGLNYAFRFELPRIKLAVGLSTELENHRLVSGVMDGAQSDPNDPIIDDYMNGRWFFDASLGFYTNFLTHGVAGISFINLVQARLDDIEGDGGTSPFQYYTIFGAYAFEFEQSGITLEPSVKLRSARHSPTQFDLNLLTGFFNRQFLLGASYKTIGAMGILAGTQLGGFHLYYSYDLSFQEFNDYHSGSHEVTVMFSFAPLRDRDSYTPQSGYRK